MEGKRVPQSPGFLLSFAPDGVSTSRAILLLHGFPGEVNRQNRDLAAHLAESLNLTAFVPCYEGLGPAQQGRFSFRKSIQQGFDVLDFLTSNLGYTKVDVIGHSWGGLIALNLYRRRSLSINGLVLMSPLTKIPDPDKADEIVSSILSEKSDFFSAGSKLEVLQELEFIRTQQEPREFANELSFVPGKAHLIQASKDDEVSPELSRAFAERFGAALSYTEIAQGHTFLEDRAALFSLVKSCLERADDALL